MNSNSLLLLVLCVLSLALPLLQAQIAPASPVSPCGIMAPADDPIGVIAKRSWGFDAWPGKTAPLKAGFLFAPGDYPELNGHTVTEDHQSVTLSVDSRELGSTRVVRLHVGQIKLTITEYVGNGCSANVHEQVLWGELATSSAPLFATMARGADLGDFSLLDGPTAPESNGGGFVVFTRNNIAFSLTLDLDGSDLASRFPLVGLAKRIDSLVQAQPDQTLAQFEASRPVIVSFASEHATLARRSVTDVNAPVGCSPLGSIPCTRIDLLATDPRGLVLAVEYQGLSSQPAPGEKAEFHANGPVGDNSIRVSVVNAAGLSRTAACIVKVVDAPE